MKKYIFLMAALIMPLLMEGQAKKPTIMVVPADVWCSENGYMTTYDNQGDEVSVPDYEKAMQNDMDLVNAITKIGELMAERGLPLKDLASTVRSIRQSSAEDEMTVSRSSGSSLAESPLDKLLNRAKADILVELAWKINTVGPKQSVTYTLRGIDAYTNKQVAAAQGTGAPSFSAEIPVLIEEATLEKMDGFIAQLQAHFDDLLANGREVNVNIRVFDNGSGMSLEDEYDGYELIDIIDDWMAQNTVQHRYSLTDATENMMRFEQVRIPLYRENGMPMDTRRFVTELRRYLSKEPFNITSKVLTKGLGRADLVLGEK
ncbi:MAG: hypothetical protein IAB88_06530 [Bacteroidetes bacterium]|uniref:Uncharacterized protein n=1 Tax=Candidatus Limisoma faecipullorum TaxID=2840854 RepID=A0A9D9IQ08_9BACT|nr:hypothetical protein [Candidatus Limisoma faecipullorum]